jgi:hypothetical protein
MEECKMKCPSCGNDIPSSAKFCPKCGVSILQIAVEELSDAIEGSDSYTESVIAPNGEMSNLNIASDGILQNNEKKNFEWKDQHTYITIGVGLVLAVIIGLAIRIAKSNSVNDGYVSIKQDTNYDEENDIDSDTDFAQEYFYDEGDDNENYYEEQTVFDINVEEEVINIREAYNNIVDDVKSGNYYQKITDNGISAYYEGSVIRLIVVPKGIDGNYYAEYFYYDSYGDIIFSYYVADDASRLYFVNSRLIRWRYSANSNDAQNAENHDLEDNSQFDDWEENVLADSSFYLNLIENAEDFGQSEYILPGSDGRYLDETDLYGLSAEECRLARNELYARYGRKFDDEGLRAYFESKEWYSGMIDPSDFKEDMLNDYEIYNRDLIVEYEKKQGYR